MINQNWVMETVIHRIQTMCQIIKETHGLTKSAYNMIRNAHYLMIYALNAMKNVHSLMEMNHNILKAGLE